MPYSEWPTAKFWLFLCSAGAVVRIRVISLCKETWSGIFHFPSTHWRHKHRPCCALTCGCSTLGQSSEHVQVGKGDRGPDGHWLHYWVRRCLVRVIRSVSLEHVPSAACLVSVWRTPRQCLQAQALVSHRNLACLSGSGHHHCSVLKFEGQMAIDFVF